MTRIAVAPNIARGHNTFRFLFCNGSQPSRMELTDQPPIRGVVLWYWRRRRHGKGKLNRFGGISNGITTIIISPFILFLLSSSFAVVVFSFAVFVFPDFPHTHALAMTRLRNFGDRSGKFCVRKLIVSTLHLRFGNCHNPHKNNHQTCHQLSDDDNDDDDEMALV